MPQLDIGQLQLPAEQLHTLQNLLAQCLPQAEVWAYGSRVSGRAHEGSDLDLVLRNPADLSADVDHWADLQEALQNSSLPILVEAHLWSRLPAAFHANIAAAYIVLQAGTNPSSAME